MSLNEPLRVLVIEDESHLCQAIVDSLVLEGHDCVGVNTLRDADRCLLSYGCDLLVLDLGLPDGDGWDWYKSRTDLADTKVIVASARSDEAQRLAIINEGAQAYFVKPVPLDTLVSAIAGVGGRG